MSSAHPLLLAATIVTRSNVPSASLRNEIMYGHATLNRRENASLAPVISLANGGERESDMVKLCLGGAQPGEAKPRYRTGWGFACQVTQDAVKRVWAAALRPVFWPATGGKTFPK